MTMVNMAWLHRERLALRRRGNNNHDACHQTSNSSDWRNKNDNENTNHCATTVVEPKRRSSANLNQMTRLNLPPLPQSSNYARESTPTTTTLSLQRKQRRARRGITATSSKRRLRRVLAPSSSTDQQQTDECLEERTTVVRFDLEANQTFADYCPALEHPDVYLKSDLYYSTDDVEYFRHQVKLVKQQFVSRLKKNDVEKDPLLQHYRRMIQAYAASSPNKNITTAPTPPRINHDDDASSTSSSSSSVSVANKPAALSWSSLHDDEEEDVSTAATGDHPRHTAGASSDKHDDDEAWLFLLELMLGLPGGSWIMGPGAWRRDTKACREALQDVLDHYYDEPTEVVDEDGSSSSSITSSPAVVVVDDIQPPYDDSISSHRGTMGDSEEDSLVHECRCLTARHVLLAHGFATFYATALSS